ncbi:hypothetical protein BDW71DRAFT_193199 [Aspergillus fruticulosus]
MAESFYTQCQVGASREAATCGLGTKVMSVRPSLEVHRSVDHCPFGGEDNCQWNSESVQTRVLYEAYPPLLEWQNLTTVLRLEYHDLRPWHYGLNADSRIRQSHRLTCSPIRVRQFEVASILGRNTIAFWLGGGNGSFNENLSHQPFNSEFEHITYLNLWNERNKYSSDGRLSRDGANGPWKGQSSALYQLPVYPVLVEREKSFNHVYVNFHSDLSHPAGDMLITMLTHAYEFKRYPGSSNVYAISWEDMLANVSDDWDKSVAHALGCYEQYQLCFTENCTPWSNRVIALDRMAQILGKNVQTFMPIYRLLLEGSSLTNFMLYHHRSSLTIRSLFRRAPWLEKVLLDWPQWQWEVRAWFELSFLMTKFNLLASIQGESGQSNVPTAYYNNTDWICDKLLFLDGTSINVNGVGLLATISALSVLCLTSVAPRVHTMVKPYASRWYWILRIMLTPLEWLFESLLRHSRGFRPSYVSYPIPRWPALESALWGVSSRDAHCIGYVEELPSSRSIDLADLGGGSS